MRKVFLGLVHYPVLNSRMETIVTSVTNMDLHDISRSALCAGLSGYYIVHPDPETQRFVQSVKNFWQTDKAMAYNPHRQQALSIIHTCDSLQTLIDTITTQEAMRPVIVTTTARSLPGQITYTYLRNLCDSTVPVLILFGTGYGLSDEIHALADHVLMPIRGVGDYNHLSVRSAVAVILDRISSDTIYGRNHGYSATSWQRPNQNRLSRISRWRYGKSPL